MLFYCLDVEVFRDITENGESNPEGDNLFIVSVSQVLVGEGGIDGKTIACGRRDSLGIEETKPRRL